MLGRADQKNATPKKCRAATPSKINNKKIVCCATRHGHPTHPRDSSPAALNDRPGNPPKWYHIDCYLGVVCNDGTQGLALCSLPRKCMAQCRAGLVFDKLNIAPLGMLNQAVLFRGGASPCYPHAFRLW